MAQSLINKGEISRISAELNNMRVEFDARIRNLEKLQMKGGGKKPWWAGWRGSSPNKTQRRKMKKKCGKKCFLGPNMSFPICNKGSCKRNKKGIMSAYIRAKQWGKPRSFYKNYWGKPHMKRKVYTRVAKKARKLMGWKKGGRRLKTRKKRGGDPRRYEERLFFTTMAGDEFSIGLMPPYDSDNGGTAIGVYPDDDREIARWMDFEEIQEVLLKYLEELNRKAAERRDGGKYTINKHTNIHLVLPNRQVVALGSTEWRRLMRARDWAPHYWFKFDQVLDEAWVDKRILKSRLGNEAEGDLVDQPGRLIHIFLSHNPEEGHPSLNLNVNALRGLRAAAEGRGGRRKTKRKKRGGRRKKRKTRRKRAGGTGPDGPPEEGSQEANLRREQWGMGGENRIEHRENRIEHPLWPWQIEAQREAKDRATEAARDKNKEEREMEEFIKAQDAILFYKTKWPGNWDPNGLPIISKRELFNSLINLFMEAREIKRKQYKEKGKTYQFTDKEMVDNVTVSLSSLPDVVSWEEFREWHKGKRGQMFDKYREFREKHPEIIAEYNARLSKPRPVPKE